MHTRKVRRHPKRYARVKDLPGKPGYEWLGSEMALRHLLFKAKPRRNSKGEPIPTNGLFECGAVIKLSRRIIIDLDRFDQWVEQHRAG